MLFLMEEQSYFNMAQKIRYFTCAMPNCHQLTAIDLNQIKKPLSNIIKCSNCGKLWATTMSSACCAINIKFVSIENGNKKPMVFMQSYPKG